MESEGRERPEVFDSVNPGQAGHNDNSSPALADSSTNQVVPGSVVSAASPADATVQTPAIEADLSRPRVGPFSAPALSSIGVTQKRPSDSHANPSDSTADYFSSKESIGHSEAQRTGSTPQRQNTDPKAFIEAARTELYGSSNTYTASPHTVTPSDPSSHVTNTSAAGRTFASKLQPSLRTQPVRSITEHPSYPNQALAALQNQIYFPRQSPHILPRHIRNASTASSKPSLYTPTSPTLSVSHDGKNKPRSSWTMPNSPAQTPLVFPSPDLHRQRFPTLNVDGLVDGADDQESFPCSPYLHAVSAQPPRTVTSADRQVDTFSGRKMINHYEIQKEIGRGVHGKVKLARDLGTGTTVAIKIVQRYSKRWRLGKSGGPEDKVKKEIAILKKVQHPNVVRLIEVIDDPEISKVYLVLEYCENKDIKWRTSGNNEIVLAEYLRQASEFRGDSVETQESQFRQIEKMIERKAKKETRRRRQLYASKQATSGDDSHTWSLEYGPDTDDESNSASEYGSVSGSTATQGDERSVDTTYEELVHRQRSTNSFTATDARPVTSATDLPTTPDVSQVRSFTSSGGFRSRQSEPELGGYSFYGLERFQEQQPSLSNPSIEEIRAGRHPSVAESVASQITLEVEQEVPDESRYVPTLSIAECRSAFRDAVVGLDYLHYHGIIHRDIKPENLLRTRDRRVKISDFGVSYLGRPVRDGDESGDVSEVEATSFEAETELAKTVGTPAFYAPELCALDVDAQTPAVTKQIDVWALGATLFCLLFAKTPFNAQNEFVLMKKIWKEEVFIPRRRLKAVDEFARSAGPDGALFSPEKRLPSQWLHEDIDDELYDLLNRLFKKAPKERISIREIKHHPWVLRGIQDPDIWLEETDPARIESGKKIEISNEEVAHAVVPIMDRLKSITKRATSALGLGGRRKRGQSSATSLSSDGGPQVTTPDITENDRHWRGFQVNDTSVPASAISTDRDHEHPLSRSVAASPIHDSVPDQSDKPLDASITIPEDQPLQTKLSAAATRPGMPDRQVSEMSTSGSIKTIRASDIEKTGGRSSASPPSTETHSPPEAVAPSSLGALLGSAGRNFLRSIRSRDRMAEGSSPSTSASVSPHPTDRSSSAYGEPSVAVSNTSAIGHVGLPFLRGRVGESSSSPTLSQRESEASLSEDSEKTSNVRIPVPATHEATFHPSRFQPTPTDFGGGMSRGAHVYTPQQSEPTDEEYHKAIDDLSRRRVLQDLQDKERLSASQSGSSINQQPCPPSPDDESPQRNQNSGSSSQGYFNSPSSIMSSSEDHFTSVASRSTSFPSVPSMASADSSIVPDAYSSELLKTDGSASSEGTYTGTPASPQPFFQGVARDSRAPASDGGYAGDADGNGDDNHGVGTDEDDSSDSDDEFLQLGRKKKLPRGQVSTATSLDERAKSGSRDGSDTLPAESHAEASRSGSSTTVKEARGDDDHEVEHLS